MAEALLEGRGLYTGYAGSDVLRGVSVRIGAGEIVAIVGPSGSGKTTLLRTLAGMLPPLAGEVALFGKDPYGVRDLERNALLRRTGMLFQHDALFGSMSILENVLLPLRELTSLPEEVMVEMARLRLALVGLAELAERFPAAISGGQRRRVALARASILDPAVLFCDEPTSGLDPIAAARVEQLLVRLRDLFGTTIVVVTHELATVHAVSDRVVMLGRGEICAEGTVAQLQSITDDPDVYRFFRRVPPESSADEARLQALGVVE